MKIRSPSRAHERYNRMLTCSLGYSMLSRIMEEGGDKIVEGVEEE